MLSPPLDIPFTLRMGGNRLGDNLPRSNGEAAHTIPEECERLFCDKMSTIFLGEGGIARQESLGMGVFRSIRPNSLGQEHPRIELWIELWDYTNDAIYRGFVTDIANERTLFVFFGEDIIGHDLKSGYAVSLHSILFLAYLWLSVFIYLFLFLYFFFINFCFNNLHDSLLIPC